MILLVILASGLLCAVIALSLPADAWTWKELGPGLLFVVLGLFLNLIAAEVLIALHRRRASLALLAGVFAKPLMEIGVFLADAGPKKIGGNEFETLLRKYADKGADPTFIERNAVPAIATECRRLYPTEGSKLIGAAANVEAQSTKFSSSWRTDDAIAFHYLGEKIREFCDVMNDNTSPDLKIVEAYLDLFIARAMASQTIKLDAFARREIQKRLKHAAN